MAEKFYTILTKVGKAKIANATALGNKVNFTTLKVGDGGGKYYNPTEEQEDLVNEVWQGNINSIRVDENNPNWVVIEVIIPSSVGGFMIREAGVFDDENNMLAIGKYPETYKPQAQDGSTKDLVIRTNLEISNTSSVTLKVDPTVILATQKDIQIINSNMVDLGKRVSKNEENITSIKSDLADITTDENRLTGDKTITGAINELFTNASNGKSSIANVVGNPLLATDTFQQQRDKMQTLKNILATNLTDKEQNASSTESLQSLINKVADINIYTPFSTVIRECGNYYVSQSSYDSFRIINNGDIIIYREGKDRDEVRIEIIRIDGPYNKTIFSKTYNKENLDFYHSYCGQIIFIDENKSEIYTNYIFSDKYQIDIYDSNNFTIKRSIKFDIPNSYSSMEYCDGKNFVIKQRLKDGYDQEIKIYVLDLNGNILKQTTTTIKKIDDDPTFNLKNIYIKHSGGYNLDIYDLNMNLVKQVKFYLGGAILAVSNKDNNILDKLGEKVVKIKGM